MGEVNIKKEVQKIVGGVLIADCASEGREFSGFGRGVGDRVKEKGSKEMCG